MWGLQGLPREGGGRRGGWDYPVVACNDVSAGQDADGAVSQSRWRALPRTEQRVSGL